MTIQVPKRSSEIAQQYLTDFEYVCIDVGIDDPPIQRGTDPWLDAHALSKILIHGWAYIAQADADRDPTTASATGVERWRVALGLPEIGATASYGRIRPTISGTRSLLQGEILKANGVRYEVTRHYAGLTDGDEVDVRSIDIGKHTELKSGEEIKFADTPAGFQQIAKVSATVPITGGVDSEDTERKRTRVLNRLRYVPGGENPGHRREMVLNNFPGVQNVFIYPALGGPGSEKIVVVKALDSDNNDFSRQVDEVLLDSIRAKIQALSNRDCAIYVQSAADEWVDVSLTLDLPDSVLAGGDGTGWVDAAPWPPLAGSDTKVTVTTVTSSTQITVDASTTTAPVAGLTSVAWWSSADQRFRTYLVTEQSGGTGAWVLHLDSPLLDSDDNPVAVGDYISPAAANLQAYGDTWRSIVGTLGPGENTTHEYRLPNSQRFPTMDEGPQCELNTRVTMQLQQAHEEIYSATYSYRSQTTPTVPGDTSPSTAPNVLALQHFGVYQETS